MRMVFSSLLKSCVKGMGKSEIRNKEKRVRNSEGLED